MRLSLSLTTSVSAPLRLPQPSEVISGHLDIVLFVDERRHDGFERDAVALEERRTLGLAVVGQHDDVVRAGRLGDGVFETGELLVEAAERVERRRREDPGMVGDLVVTDEVGVRRRHAAVDVAHQGVQGEVAQDGRRGCTQDRDRSRPA